MDGAQGLHSCMFSLPRILVKNLKENDKLEDLDTEEFSEKTYLSEPGCGQF